MSDLAAGRADDGGDDGRRRNLLVCAALLALVAAVFGRVGGHDFVTFDDPAYVDRADVRGGLTAGNVASVVTDLQSPPYYTPITHLTHLLDHALWGRRPGAHHLTSVAIHAANAALLYLLLVRWDRRRWVAAAAVAAAFAVHPLRAESVAWMAERKDVVSALFFLLLLHAYTTYARAPGAARYGLVALLLVLGLLSKPMLVTAPAVLLLLDYWPLRRSSRPAALAPSDGEIPSAGAAPPTRSASHLVLEKLPLVALCAASAIITVVGQRAAGAVQALDQLPLTARLGNALVSYARYLGKTLWPTDLAVFYPMPDRWPAWAVISSAALLLAITIVALAGLRRRPAMAVGWLWFLGMLLPVIGLMQAGRQAMADRFTYLPHVGLFIAIAYPLAELSSPSRALRRTALACTGLMILALSSRTFDQLRHWRDTETLFVHALDVTGDDAVAFHQLATIRFRQGRLDDAEAMYREAVRIQPRYALAHMNLGHLLMRQRRFAEAIPHYESAIRQQPNLARAHAGLGGALRALGQRDAAEQSFGRALRLDPKLESVRRELAALRSAATHASDSAATTTSTSPAE